MLETSMGLSNSIIWIGPIISRLNSRWPRIISKTSQWTINAKNRAEHSTNRYFSERRTPSTARLVRDVMKKAPVQGSTGWFIPRKRSSCNQLLTSWTFQTTYSNYRCRLIVISQVQRCNRWTASKCHSTKPPTSHNRRQCMVLHLPSEMESPKKTSTRSFWVPTIWRTLPVTTAAATKWYNRTIHQIWSDPMPTTLIFWESRMLRTWCLIYKASTAESRAHRSRRLIEIMQPRGAVIK